MSKEYTIDRDQLVYLARRAIEITRERDVVVPQALVRKLLKVARTASEIVEGEWWYKDCGCLVGTLYGRPLELSDDLTEAEWNVGITFDDLLSAVIRVDTGAGAGHIVQVIDKV